MKLISVAWSYGIVILKLFHSKIKFIFGKMKSHVNSLLEKLGFQKKKKKQSYFVKHSVQFLHFFPEAEVQFQRINFWFSQHFNLYRRTKWI